jgi:hypothetical protein
LEPLTLAEAVGVVVEEVVDVKITVEGAVVVAAETYPWVLIPLSNGRNYQQTTERKYTKENRSQLNNEH